MNTWDAIVIGAGIIGLSLAIDLNKRGLRVLIVEKGEPGREASWAAGGMLCDFPLETAPALLELATASARMYPEFVHELQEESGLKIDLRSVGTLAFQKAETRPAPTRYNVAATQLSEISEAAYSCEHYALPSPLSELEPALEISNPATSPPLFVSERCVDPRDLTAAAITAARLRGIDFSTGDRVQALEVAHGKATGVRTSKTRFVAGMVVNCAGAWAGQIGQHSLPTRPVKGQMLCVVMPEKTIVRHVIRTPDVYLIPRSDGRMLIGATAEEAGFDKQVVPETIQVLREAALGLVPNLSEARILESWAGLRPGTPDGLPILGTTDTSGYFAATGHFRDGILLAPVSAKIMGGIMTGLNSQFNLSAFSASRFAD